MWDVVTASPQAHNSDDDRHQFFRQDAQRLRPVLNRFKMHHCGSPEHEQQFDQGQSLDGVVLVVVVVCVTRDVFSRYGLSPVLNKTDP